MSQVPKIATTAPARTVAGIAVPAASKWLIEAMAHVANPHPDVGRDLAAIRPGVREEAGKVAASLAPLLEPATIAQWSAFLLPLRVMPNSPTSRDGFEAAARTFAFAMNDVPGCVLTANHQREALRSLRFWPTPHDLDKVLRGAVNELKAEYRALTLVAKAPEASARGDLREEERDRIATGLAALAKDLAARALANEAGDRARVTKPLPLHPHALLRGYEESGTPAGQFRAAQLRKALEQADADARDS